MSRTILVDDQVWAVVSTTAKLSNTKPNDVIRGALGLPVKYEGMASSEDSQVDLHRKVTIDEMVLDHNLKGTKPLIWHGPAGTERDVSSWAEVIVTTAEWLIDTDRVNGDLPSIDGMRKHPLISTDRRMLSHPTQAKQVGQWWVETWGNVNTKGRNLRRLLRSAGVDPVGFTVTLSDTT